MRAQTRAAALAEAPASAPAVAADDVEALREAVERAAERFEFYAAQHSAKGTEDAHTKAQANYGLASEMRAALASTQRKEG